MRRMDKDKITILNDDTTYLDIQLTTNQSGEGIYRLYPSPEDELTFTVYYRKAIVPDPLHPEETLVVDVVDEKRRRSVILHGDRGRRDNFFHFG